ncbi:hypothetical protein CC1G_14047 [Coprinopsis cinerea okayama7|uniref:Uncharacterized protein n=1 Tax=Coprinopsis cinerea (strain Okayama-7 / 130 / ATCC MYA-4618 / FGSC 9003) TaxID=240176 RepID=D6RL23_COPC7|nr:hypothetical protein CC1G_14047 [Coprinopsis cinerea okayama7\|eukprot:XP_002912009.1 hypothetical protein CC1G_14047 [Coprinopsis cinerea okayama7\
MEQLSSFSRILHRAGQNEVHRRLEQVAQPFLEGVGFDMTMFIDFLEVVDGAVIGSLARAFFLLHLPAMNDEPALRFVTITVRAGMMDTAKARLSVQGYTEWEEESVLVTAVECVKQVAIGQKVADTNGGIRIRIVESRGHSLLPLAGSPSTYDTVAFTATHVYSISPTQFFSNVAIVSRYATLDDVGRTNPRFRVTMDNGHWDLHCGHECPAEWRKFRRSSGMGAFLWRQDVEDELQGYAPTWDGGEREVDKAWRALVEAREGIKEARVKFRLLAACDNPACIHYGDVM